MHIYRPANAFSPAEDGRDAPRITQMVQGARSNFGHVPKLRVGKGRERLFQQSITAALQADLNR
ncbi:hypothetical protein, partial [Pseudoponticoccus marisrubri]|uniref:hypothetical protein n=1 Tax=Pseudoponticoccus marisrubri TaxID=1685382 RepID=UPI001969ED1F